MPLLFELVSPERLLVSEEVEMVVVPGADGDFGVLEGHAPLISALRPGTIDIHGSGAVARQIFVASGFSEVAGDRCTVLAEEAVDSGDIDLAAAEQRVATARETLAGAEDDATRQRAENELSIAQARVEAAAGSRP